MLKKYYILFKTVPAVKLLLRVGFVKKSKTRSSMAMFQILRKTLISSPIYDHLFLLKFYSLLNFLGHLHHQTALLATSHCIYKKLSWFLIATVYSSLAF
jgi:hypothetical protein